LTAISESHSQESPLTRRLLLVFAVASGMCAANLYYAQPILHTIARTFGSSSVTAGLIVTFAQLGYASGLVLVVPLGDLLVRRRLVPVMLVVTAAALIASAAAPNIAVLIGMGLLVGAGSVVAQVLVPMAASLADDERRGQVVGTVMSGLLLGILLARTASGIVAGLTSWRVVYGGAAALSLVLAVVLARTLPDEAERPKLSYGSLLRTTAGLLRSEPILRRRAVLGALGFAAFSAFWTTMAFLLAGSPYHYGDLVIGLFGLVGAAGALCASFAGRWADRDLTRGSTLVFAALIAVSFVALWLGRHSLPMLILGIIVLDVGVQGMQITNQSLIYRLAPHLRSRITSAYMVCYFAGGAAGSAIASDIYGGMGWAGLCVLGAGIGLLACLMATADAVVPVARRVEPAALR
jgi:predicted MFS family arabinose efflux permease